MINRSPSHDLYGECVIAVTTIIYATNDLSIAEQLSVDEFNSIWREGTAAEAFISFLLDVYGYLVSA